MSSNVEITSGEMAPDMPGSFYGLPSEVTPDMAVVMPRVYALLEQIANERLLFTVRAVRSGGI